MTMISITNTPLKFNTAAVLPVGVAIDTTDGLGVVSACDQKMLLILEKTGAAGDLIIKSGDAAQGVGDLAVNFTAVGTKVMTIESGKFIQTNGVNRGKIVVTGVGKVSCVVLP